MSVVRRLWYRIRLVFRRSELESSMDAEMRYHLECETNARIAMGMPPAEARRTALRDFGGVDRYKEEARDQRGFRAAQEFLYDARHALRRLRRHREYAVATVLTFALGIGFTTALFSVVNGILLRPLPYREPNRLAVLWERNVARSVDDNVVSVPNFERWRERSRSFSGMAALVPSPVTLSGDDPERVMGADVSPGYFSLLGVAPAFGRDIAASDVAGGAGRVAVLSDGLWRRRFGADRRILGRSILLDNQPFTVIGVMPAGFEPPKFGWLPNQQLWFPFQPTPDNRNWGRFLLVVGRLRDGVSLDAARREIAQIADQSVSEDPKNKGWSASVVGLSRQITGEVRRPLLVLLGAMSLLLLMATTNVASLTVGFIRRRAQELSVRQAIGASQGRIMRELLTHSLVVGVVSCAASLVVAVLALRGFLALLPQDVPRLTSVRLDAGVLGAGLAIGLVAATVVGLVAALRGSRQREIAGVIGRPAGRATSRLGSGSLVAAEIAFGVVLTVLASLTVRSFANLRSVDLGFEPVSVVSARLSLPGVSYDTKDRQRAFFDALGDRLRAMPGVQSVSFATIRPFECCAPATTVIDPTIPQRGEPAITDVRYVDSSFFAALKIPLIAGPGLVGREIGDGPPRAVVSAILAKSLWGDASAIGRTVVAQLGDWQTGQPVRATVVGVAGDVHLQSPRTPPRGTIYLATTRFPSTVRDLIVRADGNKEAVISTIKTALRSVDPTLPLYLVAALDDAVDQSLARDRFTTMILSAFAIVALLLAAVGVYGVFAAEVAAREKEIGVRIALGARGSGILTLVLRRAVGLAAVGAVVGVAAGLVISRSMKSLVFGVATSDPASFGGVAALLLAVAMVATLVPAVRAMRVSPLDAIRSD